MMNEPRTNERREHCKLHDTQTKEIVGIGNAVQKHTGQWTILMWGVGLIGGLLIMLGVIQNNNLKETQIAVVGMDKTFTAYIATARVENREIARRVDGLEALFNKHELRIDKLEK